MSVRGGSSQEVFGLSLEQEGRIRGVTGDLILGTGAGSTSRRVLVVLVRVSGGDTSSLSLDPGRGTYWEGPPGRGR